MRSSSESDPLCLSSRNAAAASASAFADIGQMARADWPLFPKCGRPTKWPTFEYHRHPQPKIAPQSDLTLSTGLAGTPVIAAMLSGLVPQDLVQGTWCSAATLAHDIFYFTPPVLRSVVDALSNESVPRYGGPCTLTSYASYIVFVRSFPLTYLFDDTDFGNTRSSRLCKLTYSLQGYSRTLHAR